MIHQTRIKPLNNKEPRDRSYVVYWMQASQRARYNHALEYAIRKANELHRMLVVFFGITGDYPNANARHYAFMLEGLQEVREDLHDRGIQMVVWKTSPELGLIEFAKDVCMVVTDRGYTNFQCQWRMYVANRINCPLIQVESDVVVPIQVVSDKQEYAARTIRPKIQKHLDEYLQPLQNNNADKSSLHLTFDSFSIDDIDAALQQLNVDHSVKKVEEFKGGYSQAKSFFEDFIQHKLDRYDELKNDPTEDVLSKLSPYLHFGQISPLEIALEVQKTDSPGKDAYLEELIVRRELSMNYCYFNQNYANIRGIPDWAQKTLTDHANDHREYIYSYEEFEKAKTHDPYWNAAQMEMVKTGKMHGYMRMYWGKKILEWSESPEVAYNIALTLNDKYNLDGRDPNGFTGVAWCFGTHDQGWKERPIYGKVRYMNANGLKRKFDANKYVKQVEQLGKEVTI